MSKLPNEEQWNMLDKAIADLQKQVDVMKQEQKERDEPNRWKPERGEMYHLFNSVGEICYTTWTSHQIDFYRYTTGNCFRTREEAQFALERHNVLAELQVFADEHNEPMDWDNGNTREHSIFFNHKDNKLSVVDHWQHQFCGVTHFSSQKLAEEAIEKFGDRLKKYVFGATE